MCSIFFGEDQLVYSFLELLSALMQTLLTFETGVMVFLNIRVGFTLVIKNVISTKKHFKFDDIPG